jgi:pimeloyl-ACP methyl ester carboxylesterase/DNA-binding SARP family transcriptional activator
MLCLLGQPGIRSDGRFAPLVLRPKAVALLAYLALAGGQVERGALARQLFPAAEDPRAALRWHLAHLRAAAPAPLNAALRATRERLALALPTDVGRFRQGAERLCSHPDDPEAGAILALYRDDLLAGLAISASADFDTWLYVEQDRARRLLRRAALVFARCALGQHRAAETLGPLARLVSVDPYCEEGHLLLIEAYARLGQRDRAAASYDRYQRIMRRDLHLEPQPTVARRFEPTPPVGRAAPREELVPLREVTIHVVDWPGAEPAVLAIHGSAASAHFLGALAERLAPRHRFVALDLRGHGFSDKPPSGYDLADHVEDATQLIAALGLRRPVLLGYSAGGTIAAFVAGRAEVSGLILLEGLIGDRAFAENAAALVAPLADSLDRRFDGFGAYLAEMRARRSPWGDEAERLVDRWARYDLAPLPDGTYRRRALRAAVEREWASIAGADSLGALARVRCPILIVQALQPFMGGQPYFTDAIVAAQRRAAPAAELFVARHSDHGTIARDPEPAMVEAIERFMDRSARVPGPVGCEKSISEVD